MKELETLRGQIDQLDEELARIFLQRMEITNQVGQLKRAHGLPDLDSKRETQVIQKAAAQAKDDRRRREIAHFFEQMMAISRRDMRSLSSESSADSGDTLCLQAVAGARPPVKNPRVVYQGEPGAYSEMAALSFFGEETACQGLSRFEDVFDAVHNGQADYAVVPIENSSTGAIRQVYELLAQHNHYIVGEDTVKVEHCLMAPSAASLDTLTHVYSHEQGLFQSDRFLAKHPNWVQVPFGDTAGSARYVSQCGDVTKGAICSARAAELYGLNILHRGTNHNQNNTTRFVMVSPEMELRDGANKISAMLTLPHEVGSLHEILTIFTVNNLNLVKLESRPLPGKSWEYLFFVEFTGDLTRPEMKGALQELAQATTMLRIMGNYKSNLV